MNLFQKAKKQLNTDSGAALVMVLFLITIMCTIGLAVLLLTFSDFSISNLFNDQNKAYNAAEAAQNITARALDNKVAELQEKARSQASNYIQELLADPASPLIETDGSINTEIAKAIFQSKYNEYFTAGLNDPAGFFVNIGEQGNLNSLMGVPAKQLLAAKYIDGSHSNLATLRSASYQDSSVTIQCEGSFTDNQNSTFTRVINATYSLFPDPNLIPYQIVPRVTVINSELSSAYPAVLNKALVAEKNLIVAGGTVNIIGDVLAFGTIPTKNGEEDLEAPWFRYGGIMAGIPDITALDMGGAAMAFGDYFDFNTAMTGTMVSGKINIEGTAGGSIRGDAATMGYLHTLYSNDDSDFSAISAQGSTYARSIKSEEPANYSTITLQDVYTTDNLQIDSNESQVNINGIYCGFVTAAYDINGSGLSMTDDEYRYKRTSSVIINGDSKLNLNGTSSGGVYIGGSSFLKNYVSQSYYPWEDRPYMTGISALKASSRISAAFKQYNSFNGETRLYTGNGEYITNPGYTTYLNISDPANPDTVNMLAGSDGSFKQAQRSQHFKWLWEGLWKLDTIYQRYLNASAIQISLDPDNRITGYSFGAIVANGYVYDQADFKGAVDATNFGLMQKNTWIQNFYSEIQPLLSDEYKADAAKLDHIQNSKHINDYLFSGVLNNFKSPVVIDSYGQAGVVYYCTEDCYIDNAGGVWQVNGEDLPLTSGIIIADGNIYIENGFNFTGVLLSGKNIVFTGNSSITYDRNLVKGMLLNDQIAELFRLKRFMVERDHAVNQQRINYQNIKLTSLKEIE